MTRKELEALRGCSIWLASGIRVSEIADLALQLAKIVEEVAGWECECEYPEPGESGIVKCLGCRAREALMAETGEINTNSPDSIRFRNAGIVDEGC